MARGKEGGKYWTEIKQETPQIDPEAERRLEYEREVSAAWKAKKRISRAREKQRRILKETHMESTAKGTT